MSSDINRPHIEKLSNVDLERIITNSDRNYSDDIRQAAARQLIPRLTITIPRRHFGGFVGPQCCGACGEQPTVGSTKVSTSQLGRETSDTVSIAIQLCAECIAPIKRVEKATDNPITNLLISVGCVTLIAMLIALFSAVLAGTDGLWVGVFGVPALICVLIMKAMEYAAARALPDAQRALYDRAKAPVWMLHHGHEITLTFINATFFAEFWRLNGRRLIYEGATAHPSVVYLGDFSQSGGDAADHNRYSTDGSE